MVGHLNPFNIANISYLERQSVAHRDGEKKGLFPSFLHLLYYLKLT